jgi:hypothetical protein
MLRKIGADDLDRNGFPRLGVYGLVHRAHTTLAKYPDDFVRTDLLKIKRHVGWNSSMESGNRICVVKANSN